MEPEYLAPCSRQSTTGQYPESDESSSLSYPIY
jgi:hypothetical protein